MQPEAGGGGEGGNLQGTDFMMVGGCFQNFLARKCLVLSGWVIFFQREVPSTFCVGIFVMQEVLGTFW